MGCWSETCAATNLPINVDDECVMVVYSNDPEHKLHLFVDNPHFHLKSILGIFRGKYDDYGWVEGVDESICEDGIIFHNRAFFHKAAWEWGVDESEASNPKYFEGLLESYYNMIRTLDDLPEEKREDFGASDLLLIPEHLDVLECDEYMKVKEACRSVRKDIVEVGSHFSGSQRNDLKPYKSLNSLTESIMGMQEEKSEEEDV